MAHSPSDYFSVLSQMQAFAASDTTSIVRVEWNDTVTVKRLLDLGAPGILFPMIQTVEEAKVLPQLETSSAVEQAEAIADVDGVSGIFFGPADIAADIGKLGKPMDPDA